MAPGLPLKKGRLGTMTHDYKRHGTMVPAVYFGVGITPNGVPPMRVAPNHSPRFRIDEAGLLTGLRALLHVSFDYLSAAGK